MNDRGRSSDKRKEQAASSGKPRDVLRAQALERKDQSKGGEKPQHPRETRDFRRTLHDMRPRGIKEMNIPQDHKIASKITGKSGLVESRSPENISLNYGMRKGMDRGESSSQSTSQQGIQPSRDSTTSQQGDYASQVAREWRDRRGGSESYSNDPISNLQERYILVTHPDGATQYAKQTSK